MLVLISFVPAGTWTVEPLPPVLLFANWTPCSRSPSACGRSSTRCGWRRRATAAALVLGLARRLDRPSGRRGRRRLAGALESLVAIPWALPGTVFAVALAATFSRPARPGPGRFVLVGTPVDPAAGVPGPKPAADRAAPPSPACGSSIRPSKRRRRRSAPAAGGASRRVALPLLRPALAAGASLAFITALGDFVVSIVLYTFDTRPISIEILSSLRMQETGVAAAYGVLLAALSAASFLVFGAGGRRGDRRGRTRLSDPPEDPP